MDNSKNLQKFEFGPEGVAYIKECLAQGHLFSEFLIEHTDFDQGNVFTYLPSETDQKSAKEFSYGGKLPKASKDRVIIKKEGDKYLVVEPKNLGLDDLSISPSALKYLLPEDGKQIIMEPTPDLKDHFIPIIESSLSVDSRQLCIFEDVILRMRDPYLMKVKTPYWSHKDKVYHYILGNNIKSGLVENVLREASRNYITLGAVTSFNEANDLFNGKRNLQKNDLYEFAKRVQKIIVSAYDGEGYLIWEK
jgi:hypothetical protein